MKRIFGILAVLVIIAMVAMPVFAQDGVIPLDPQTPAPSAETGEFVDETPSMWFIELAGKPVVEGGSLSALKLEKNAFKANAKKVGMVYTERYSFNTLWNGFSIAAGPGEINKVNLIPGVKGIFPVDVIPMPTGQVTDPDLFTALAMTGADIVQSELGFTGKGIRVAVMDTGIDVDHPAFGGDGIARYDSILFPSARVVAGWDFVGDNFNADPSSALYNPVTVPDPNPDDCGGHGSHVAGIIGANDATNGMKGVAPEVVFGAYRVFGCEGSTTADIMVAAMEQAYKDKMDVLNMSIGSAYNWPQYPTAVAASRLVERGMVVVASIGNNGPNGLYAAGAPGLGEKVIGVASFDNTFVYLPTFTATPDNAHFGYVQASAAPAAPTSGTFMLARTGTQTTANDGCAALPADSLTGKAVLIRRGTCGFYNKALNAQLAGAASVILYNNQPGSVTPTVAPVAPLTTPITIPVVMISQVLGNELDNRLAAGSVSITWTTDKASFPNATANRISDFSSYGLSPDLALKPDIAAPGGSIYSSYPLQKGGYATLGGTSMASPHVAGAVALLLQAKPGIRAEDVRGILQNSADPKYWWGNPALGFLDMVHRQGAGMLDIDEAILSTTTITPAKLSLGESEFGPVTRTLTLKNDSAVDVTYDLSHVPALSTGPNTFTVGAVTGFASVDVSAPSVTVPAGGTAAVDVTVTANATLSDKSLYGGYIVFTPQGGGQVYRVPYAGFKGDYQSIQAIPVSTFPLIGKATSCIREVDGDCIGGSFTVPPAGYVFTMTSILEQPSLLVHFDHQVREFHVEVYNAVTGLPVHPEFYDAVYEELLPRNSSSTGFYAFTWDGTRIHSNGYNGKGYDKNLTKPVPDGQYLLKIRALKANGDRANPAHWETWTSPVVTIDRP